MSDPKEEIMIPCSVHFLACEKCTKPFRQLLDRKEKEIEAMKTILIKMTARMDLINGSPDNCVLKYIPQCGNHSVLKEAKELLARHQAKGDK